MQYQNIYYGRINNKTPKTSVVYHMLDDHIKDLINKNQNYFESELASCLKQLKKDSAIEIAALKRQLKEMDIELKRATKRADYLWVKEKAIEEMKSNEEKEMAEVKAKVEIALGKEVA